MSERLMPKWNKEIGIMKTRMTRSNMCFTGVPEIETREGNILNGYSWKIFRTVNTNPHIQQA